MTQGGFCKIDPFYSDQIRTCYDKYTSSEEDTSSGGKNKQYPWSSAESDGEFMYIGKNVRYAGSGLVQVKFFMCFMFFADNAS